MGIDGRIFPVSAAPTKKREAKGKTPAFEEFLDHWYPIQVKQKDRVCRPDTDAFEAVITREYRRGSALGLPVALGLPAFKYADQL